MPDYYPLPDTSPYDLFDPWIGYLDGAIAADLLNPGSWAPGEFELAYGYIEDLRAFIQDIPAMINAMPPIGAITAYIGQSPPPGWLLCDGRTLNTANYPDLYAVLPASMRLGATFVLPNMHTRTLAGTPTPLYQTGDYGGNNSMTLTVNQMPVHTHTQEPHKHGMPSRSNSAFGTLGNLPRGNNSGAAVTYDTYETTAINNNTGGGQPFDNRPAYMTVNYIIRAL